MTNKSVYIASPEALVGKSTIALGLIEALSRHVKSVGLFRPIVNGDNDALTKALLTHTGIDQTYDEVVGVQAVEAQADPEAALTSIIEQYGALQDRFDAVVIVGTDYDSTSTPTDLELNARIAANLNAPVVLVVSGLGRNTGQILSSAKNAIRAFDEQHDNIVAIIANRVDTADVDDVAWQLGELNRGVSSALPESILLSAPSVREQFEAVGATMWRGAEAWLERESLRTVIGGMSLPNMLTHLTPECTLLLASDRAEILPGLLLAHASDTFPDLAAILLVGGYEIPDSVKTLLDGIEVDIPIGTVPTGSWDTAAKLHALQGDLSSSQRKYAEGLKLFQDRVNEEALVGALDMTRTQLRTPRMFEYQIMQKARADKKTIVLPESEDPRILEATSILLSRGVANLVLLGEEAKVRADASKLGFDITGAKIQSMHDPDLVEKFAATYAELRAKKGVTIEQAREKMTDPSYFGTMMVHLGLADGMVSGATHTTANTIRPALEFIKTKPGLRTVSGSFLMCMPDKVLVFADCAVNPNPSPEQLRDIATSSAATARAFDIDPRVAMLSYSTGDSGKGEDVDAVKAAVELIREANPDFAFDGPIQFDAAMDPKVGGQKLPGSEVAGQATVFIFPDLNTGNNTYKAVQRTSGAVAVGPMLQGLNKPVNDLSRGALVADIVNTVAITAIQAQVEG